MLCLGALASHVTADTVTWVGGATGDWGTGSNWSTGSVPAAADTAQFTSPTTVTLAADQTIEGIDFGSNALTLDGSYTLKLNGAGSNNIIHTSDGELQIAPGAALDVNGRTHPNVEAYVIEIAGSGPAGDGAILNTGGSLVNTSGFSRLRLAADATIGAWGRLDFGGGGWIDSQGYTLTKTGPADVWLGSPAYNSANPSGTTNLPVVDIEQGTFGLQGSNVLGSSSLVTVEAGGTLATWGSQANNNNVILDGGILRSSHYKFGNFNTTTTWNAGTAGIVDVQADSRLYTREANMVLNVPLSGSGNLERIASTGTPSSSHNAQGTENLTLNGDNAAWTGALTNKAGKVTIGHVNALGTSAVTHTFESGSTLDLAGFDLSGQPYTIELAGEGIPIPVGDPAAPTGYAPPGALINSGATTAAIGPATLTGDTTIGAGDIDFNGVVGGAHGITKFAGGTLALNAANTWGGATNLHEGTIVLGIDNGLPSGTTLTLGNDTTSGTLKLAGNSQTLAGLLTAGTGTDNRVVNDDANSGALTVNVATGTNTFGGVLGGATAAENDFSLTKDGAGTLELTGDNSYTGTTTIAQGTLIAGHQNALGASTGGTVVADGAALKINHGDAITEPITLNGTSNPDGAVQSPDTTSNYAVNGPITLNATSNVGTHSRPMTFGGVISGPGGLVKVGSQTLYLGNQGNNYQGDTIVNAGVLKTIRNECIPDSSNMTINNNARFDLAERPRTETLAQVTINNGHIFGQFKTINGTLYEPIVISDVGFEFHKGSASAMLRGTAGLVKESADTFTLTRTNTYSGDTLINDGTLALTGDGSIHGSPLIRIAGGATFDISAVTTAPYALATGQTLAGAGDVVGDFAVTAGSVLSPGASPGTLSHTGDEIWEGGGTYLWEMNNADASRGADPGWDWLEVTGSLTIDATEANPFTIDVTSLAPDNTAGPVDNFSAAAGQSWIIATASGGIAGFAPEKFDLRLDNFANNWAGGEWAMALSGNNLVITFAVPEPSGLALAAVGLVLLALRIRRRR
jgi:autotransporter-associated beta strand protein